MDAQEYYKVRLEHTIQHTQQSTNLIYLVNGAILAMLYFVARSPEQYVSAVLLLCILSIVNIAHAALIVRQGKWYFNIDEAFKSSIHHLKEIQRPTGFPWIGSHNLFATLHLVLGLLLLGAALAIYVRPDLIPKIVPPVVNGSSIEKPACEGRRGC